MIDTTLSKRYAQALVEIGQEKDALDKYGQDLQAVNELMGMSKDFRELLINPVFPKDNKKAVTGSILDKLSVDPMVRNFVYLLIDRKRIDQLPGIETAYHGLVDDIRGITRAQVTSAQPLSETELGQVTEALTKISGKQVIVTTEVEPTYIGGLAAKVGDMVFDGTIRTQLNQLKESLKG